MRQAIFLSFFISLLAIGCGPSKTTEEISSEVEKEISLGPQYKEYLLLMNDEERARFLQLNSQEHKQRFLEARGIKMRKFLRDNLIVGMPTQQVVAILQRPKIYEKNKQLESYRQRWIYENSTEYGDIRYILTFANQKLVSWEFWPEK